jgi:anti-sigma regulatory factor (Ser/Thr protein kinase)
MSRLWISLERSVDAPATARQLCAAACCDWALEPLTDVCTLLVSELVTNAVQHGRGAISLEMTAEPAGLRVAVGQSEPMPPPSPGGMSGLDAVSGRGLAIVDALATQWGSDVDEHGTTFWFELVSDAPPHDGAGAPRAE